MYYTRAKQGFTLIELLVVILIIGILAAVALPQYQKAVMKARIAEYELNLHSMSQAVETCYLNKGGDCTLDSLDIEIPNCTPIRGLFDTCNYSLFASSGPNPELQKFAAVHIGVDTLVYFHVPAEPIGKGYGTVQGLTCRQGMAAGYPSQLCSKLGFITKVINSSGGVFSIRP